MPTKMLPGARDCASILTVPSQRLATSKFAESLLRSMFCEVTARPGEPYVFDELIR